MPKHGKKRRHTPKTTDYDSDSPKTKTRNLEEVHNEDENLDEILFGGSASFLKCLEEAEHEAGPSRQNTDSGVGEDDTTSESDGHDQLQPAWFDDEDDGIEVGKALNIQKRKLPKGGINSRSNKYSDLLKHKFTSMVGTPKWASLNKKRKTEDSDSEDEILQTCGFLAKPSHTNLPANLLEFKKVKDLNSETYNEGPFINSLEFHPSSTVALVAGNKGIATLFAVDGKKNTKLHSVAFERFPIFCAKFIHDGNEAILGSRLPHIFTYDLMAAKAIKSKLPLGLTQFKKFVTSPDSKILACAGKWGEVHLICSTTKERINLLKQDSEVTSLAYNPQGTLLYGHSDTGDITVWDMNMLRVKHKFTDEGCLQGTTLDISSSNQFLAAGSAQGVVNLYGIEDVLKHKIPKPRKTILNLTTSISSLKFNSTSEMLALTSTDVQNAVRFFHLGTGTVFNNFPTFGTKMGHLTTVRFSPNSGYVAFGNKQSTVALYRLKHFKNY